MKIINFHQFDITDNFRKELLNEYDRSEHLLKHNCYAVKGKTWSNDIKSILPSIILWAKVNGISLEEFEFAKNLIQNGSSEIDFFILLNKSQYVKSLLEFFTSDDEDFSNQLFKKLPKRSVKTISYYWEHTYNSDSISEKSVDIFIWIRDNCRSNVYKEKFMWFFEEETDATAFKLYWLEDKKK